MTEIDRREFLVRAGGGLAAVSIVPSLARAGQASSREPIGVGVVGIGRQGRLILGELSKLDGARVLGVCDPDERRARSGERRARGSKAFASLDEMLSALPGIEAVVVATPTHLHAEPVGRAIDAGKHVYCEAPLAHTVAEAESIVRSARGAQGVVAGGLQARSNPVYQLARTFFKSDAVRDLASMRAQRNEKRTWVVPSSDRARWAQLNWKLDPSVSIGLGGEWGTHQFDVFHWYTDRYPSRVIGRGAVRAHRDGREIADTISCMLEFEDGAVISYGATLGNSYQGTHEVFYGTNAAIKLAWTHGWMFKEADAPTQGWEVYANRQQFHNDEGITLIADATKLASQGKLQEGVGLPHHPVYYALEDWLDAIAAGSTPACTLAEAARATAVGIAADRAVRSEQIVDVEMPGV